MTLDNTHPQKCGNPDATYTFMRQTEKQRRENSRAEPQLPGDYDVRYYIGASAAPDPLPS
ncbi:hypothetical protein GCM10010446_47500 [Streptomyces enissocaesilis]|uniref:Uncharacterized protein n=1 Tax=Streptomyces enissocaesilis TaxID=332589 RepID=A0ABN3XJS8_9ACTN